MSWMFSLSGVGMLGCVANAFMLGLGGSCPEASDQFFSVLSNNSDDFFGAHSDSYLELGTP
jgi:hypothetical protein